jgi:hypothetical protein
LIIINRYATVQVILLIDVLPHVLINCIIEIKLSRSGLSQIDVSYTAANLHISIVINQYQVYELYCIIISLVSELLFYSLVGMTSVYVCPMN